MKSIEKKIYLGLFVCMMVSVVGISFAYFTKSTTIKGDGGSVNTSTADLIKVEYDAGSKALSLPNAIPGDKDTKTFTVKVTPTTDDPTATYSIFLNISDNTFVKCDNTNRIENEPTESTNPKKNLCIIGENELIYTLKDSSDNVLKTADLIGKTGKIELYKTTTSTTSTYTLEIEFINTKADQNHNENKTFAGSVGVEFAK